MSDSIYLVTGANRGIGEALVTELLKRSHTTVIAAVRVPSKASHLEKLERGAGTKLITVKYEAGEESDANAIVQDLKTNHGVTRLDTVIANAGIAQKSTRVLGVSAENAYEHLKINALAPVWLAAATVDLLKASSRPTFVTISSVAGSMDFQPMLISMGVDSSPYGMSKAASNWFNRRLHLEEEWLLTFGIHPGLVLTDMARETFETMPSDFDPASVGALTPNVSAQKMLQVLSKATREREGGYLLGPDGEIIKW